MPLYLCDADWNAALPLKQVLDELDGLVQRTGGQVLQVLQVDNRLSLTIETPDELSLFRVVREASALGLALSSRVALPRVEAEALDRAHRERTQ
ncbi:MAG: hypothetical protein OXH13_04630 [Chloroflexi bacterium]|nr:hypothetical protein [Chloroflexota bacterium]MCY3696097.1 hypothetical protein [Chloroflexota bacterium]MXX80288.1 hypothetical protein [Chloroflexota bacterium]MYB21661.1 hypothetical protein [Chloroflexota bacterium]MYF21571.1 hypothetical protein [Chloroflexota bacterium]